MGRATSTGGSPSLVFYPIHPFLSGYRNEAVGYVGLALERESGEKLFVAVSGEDSIFSCHLLIGAVGHLFFPLGIVILSVVTTAVFSTRQASHRFASKFIEVKLCSPYEVRTFGSALHHEGITGRSRFIIIISSNRGGNDSVTGVAHPSYHAGVIDRSDIGIRRFVGDGFCDIASVERDLVNPEIVSIVILIRCLGVGQLLLYFLDREHTHGSFWIVVLIAGEDKSSACFARFDIIVAHIIMAAGESLIVVSYLHDIGPV